jgi:hypothetical protein
MDETKAPRDSSKRRHETSDVSVRGIVIFVVALSISVILGMLFSKRVFYFFVRHQPLGPPASPFENVRTLPPQPRLQVNARADLKRYRAAQDELLNSYGWVDEKSGIVRIPVDRAMDIMLQKGFPVRGESAGKSSSLAAMNNSPARIAKREAAALGRGSSAIKR